MDAAQQQLLVELAAEKVGRIGRDQNPGDQLLRNPPKEKKPLTGKTRLLTF